MCHVHVLWGEHEYVKNDNNTNDYNTNNIITMRQVHVRWGEHECKLNGERFNNWSTLGLTVLNYLQNGSAFVIRLHNIISHVLVFSKNGRFI